MKNLLMFRFFYEHAFSIHLDKYQGAWLLDYMVRVCLVL